jgi:hypothetical protein
MNYFLAGVVMGVIVTGVSVWVVLPAGILTDG